MLQPRAARLLQLKSCKVAATKSRKVAATKSRKVAATKSRKVVATKSRKTNLHTKSTQATTNLQLAAATKPNHCMLLVCSNTLLEAFYFHKGGVVDSHIGGGVLSPEISLQSCE